MNFYFNKRYISIVFSLLIHSAIILNIQVFASEKPEDCDNLLIDVLQEILGPLRSNSLEQGKIPSFRRRCRGHLACEFMIPIVEADNVMFRNGQVHLNDYNKQTESLMKETEGFFMNRAERLSSSQVQIGTNWNWMPGPTINRSSISTYHCNGKFEDISAQFLFPWEINNAFHTVNDNVFAALGNTILNYLTSPIVPGGSPVDATQDTGTPGFDVDRLKNSSYVLYLFRSVMRTREISLMFQLLPLIYGRGNVRPAGELLKKTGESEERRKMKSLDILNTKSRPVAVMEPEIHCIKHLSWGTSMKVFYRDSLIDLRRVIFDVLHLLVRKRRNCDIVEENKRKENYTKINLNLFEKEKRRKKCEKKIQLEKLTELTNKMRRNISTITTGKNTTFLINLNNTCNNIDDINMISINNNIIIENKNTTHLSIIQKPKVIIVTRNTTYYNRRIGIRKLTASTEARLSSYYTQLGFNAIICCDFRYLNSISQVIDYFRDVDICVGIHGAGLTNCIFGRHGMVVVELQNSYNYGLDSFLKVAHMAGGHYLFYDLRDTPLSKGFDSEDGIYLNDSTLHSIVDISVKLHLYSRVLYQEKGTFDNISYPLINDEKEGRKDVKTIKELGEIEDFQDFWLKNEGRRLNSKRFINKRMKKLTQYSGFVVIDPISKKYFMQVVNEEKHIFVHDTFGFPGFTLEHVGLLRTLYGGRISGKDLFWVFTNPSIKPYTKASTLGPMVSDSSEMCLTLPFFKFRRLTTNLKLRQCDKRMLYKKPSNGVEDMFFQYFV